MISGHNKVFEDYLVPSRKKNFAIFNTALVFKFGILIFLKLVFQV